MGTSEPRLSQEILLGIMLQAYQLGTQRKDMDSRTMIDRLTQELRPYFSQEEPLNESTHPNKRGRQEAAG